MIFTTPKVTTGETDEDGLEIWEDDPESCVEVEKTKCRVQEIPVVDEEEKILANLVEYQGLTD